MAKTGAYDDTTDTQGESSKSIQNNTEENYSDASDIEVITVFNFIY